VIPHLQGPQNYIFGFLVLYYNIFHSYSTNADRIDCLDSNSTVAIAEETPATRSRKQRLVVLGSGFAAVSILEKLLCFILNLLITDPAIA
jgi:hypothetical protein